MFKKLKTIGIVMMVLLFITSPVLAEKNWRFSPAEWDSKTKSYNFGGYSATGLNILTAAMNTTGNVRYVDSGASNAVDNSGAGRSQNAPFRTLDYAVGQMTANNGDVIIVMPGYAETLSAADAVDVDVAGLTIIGLGSGTDMPEFTFGHANAEFVIGAANVTLVNLRFIAGITSITMGISIEAAGDEFKMVDCEFPKPTTNSWEFVDAIDVASGANGVWIENCRYYNDEGGAAPDHFIDAGNGTAGPERLVMINNIIKGDFAVSAIWSDEPCDEALISGNTIINHTSGQHCIEFTDTGTGVISNNYLYNATETTILDPGSMATYNNHLSIAVDLAAVPIHLRDTVNKILAGLRLAGEPIGSVFYVDNAIGVAGQSGSWALAEATLDAAISDATADKGDVVFIAPDHEETIGDAQVAADINGLTIIGLGSGEQMPMITMTHANSSVDVTGTDTWIENIHFYSTTADSSILIDCDASGLVVKDCKFTGSGAGSVIYIDIATSLSDIVIEGNYVYNTDTDEDAFINITAGAVTNLVVKNNRIWGDYDLAAIYSDQVNINAHIEGNVIRNVQTGIHAIEFSDATTGSLVGNWLYSDARATTLDPGSLDCYGNYSVDATDEGAYLIPGMGDHDVNVLGINSANNDASTSSVLANADGSVVERLEHLQTMSDDILAKLRVAGYSIGNVYYVDNATGDSADNGTTWALAEDTLANGFNNTQDDKGDIVFIAPDHEETISAAVALDEAGVMIIGLGTGEQQPMITVDNANSEFQVTAQDITIENLHIYSTTADSTMLFDVDASGFTLRNCRFTESGAGHVLTIDLATTLSDIVIEGNNYYSTDTDGDAFINATAGAITNLVVRDNRIWGDFDLAGIYSNQVNVNILIRNNIIRNVQTGIHAVEFSGATTGYLHDNILAADTPGLILDPGSLLAFNNRIVESDMTDAPDRAMLEDGWYYTSTSFELDATATTDAIFTVTGTVEVMVWGSVTETLTSHADTFACGTADSTTLLIAATAGNAPMTQGDTWTSATMAKSAASPSKYILDDDNISVTQSGANLADGTVLFHVYWRPLTEGASVVPI